MITRETDYALRMLRALLDGQLHPVGEIAAGQLIPQPFAYKILKKLSQAGLVDVVRGVSGGCRLSADLSEVSLHDLMRATGEQSSAIACMDPGYDCGWRRLHGGCAVHGRLAAIQRRIEAELQSHSLQALLAGEEDPA